MKNLSGMPLFFVIICFIVSGAVLLSVLYCLYSGIDIAFPDAIMMGLAPIFIAGVVAWWHGDKEC